MACVLSFTRFRKPARLRRFRAGHRTPGRKLCSGKIRARVETEIKGKTGPPSPGLGTRCTPHPDECSGCELRLEFGPPVITERGSRASVRIMNRPLSGRLFGPASAPRPLRKEVHQDEKRRRLPPAWIGSPLAQLNPFDRPGSSHDNYSSPRAPRVRRIRYQAETRGIRHEELRFGRGICFCLRRVDND